MATRLHRPSGRERQPRRSSSASSARGSPGCAATTSSSALRAAVRRAGAHQLLGGRVLGLGVSFAGEAVRAGAAPEPGRDDPRRIGVGGSPRSVADGAAPSCPARSAARSLGIGSVSGASVSQLWPASNLPETRAGAFDGHSTTRDRDTRRRPARLHREQRADDGRHRAGRTNTQGLRRPVRRSRPADAAREIELAPSAAANAETSPGPTSVKRTRSPNPTPPVPSRGHHQRSWTRKGIVAIARDRHCFLAGPAASGCGRWRSDGAAISVAIARGGERGRDATDQPRAPPAALGARARPRHVRRRGEPRPAWH